jgi:hypothetical protein
MSRSVFRNFALTSQKMVTRDLEKRHQRSA